MKTFATYTAGLGYALALAGLTSLEQPWVAAPKAAPSSVGPGVTAQSGQVGLLDPSPIMKEDSRMAALGTNIVFPMPDTNKPTPLPPGKPPTPIPTPTGALPSPPSGFPGGIPQASPGINEPPGPDVRPGGTVIPPSNDPSFTPMTPGAGQSPVFPPAPPPAPQYPGKIEPAPPLEGARPALPPQ